MKNGTVQSRVKINLGVVHILRNHGWGGWSLQMITVLQRGGSSQMITVLQRGVLENDYSVPRILGYYISNIISMDLTKKSGFFFSW